MIERFAIPLLVLQAAFGQAVAPIPFGGRELAAGSRVIVKFRGAAGFLPGSAGDHALGNGVHVVGVPAGLTTAETLKRYRALGGVEYAEPDYQVSTTATPNDALWSQQWDMVKIAAPTAWNSQTDASNVIVAVVDTGIDYTHPELKGNLWTNPADGSHGFTCMNGVCAAGGLDDYGHGTHVAGTIGAVANNSAGIAGINWKASILSCKFLGSNGSGPISDAILCLNQIAALRQAGYNVRVTSNSWGGGGYSQALRDALTALENAGVLNVCAAGNSSVNTDLSPMYPGAYDNRGLLSVLATDQNDLGASFTNYGVASVDIAAPGVSTYSTVPTGTCTLCDPSGYKPLSGTSMATPHVSAVAAALMHVNPGLTAAQARDVLLDPASYDLVSDLKGSLSSTGGRLNFAKALANPLLANPKLNNFPAISGVANASVQAGQQLTLSAMATDPDSDPLRKVWSRGAFNSAPGANSLWLLGWKLANIFPAVTGDSVSLTAPSLARTAQAAYAVSVADGRGGGSTAMAYATVQASGAAGLPPQGTFSVSPTSGPVGTTVAVSFPATDPEGTATGWDLWQAGLSGGVSWCCQTGATFNVPINSAGAYRFSAQAIDGELNLSTRQTAVVRIGGATGTPPLASAVFDKLSGPAPLTVNIDMSGSTDPDGSVQQYIVECRHGQSSGTYDYGPVASCVYDQPGNYWILLQAKDNDGLVDVIPAYAVVTPAGSTAVTPPPAKAGATVTLGSMTQTYTGAPLTPTATTSPAGLAVVWTNAPQTAAGSYPVTATINDAAYQGSASGTFTVNPAYGAPPTVAITSPAPGVIKSGSTTITASVTSGGNPVARVEFLVNGTLKCSDTAAPWSCAWNVPGSGGKTYQLQAKAYDSTGQVGSSAVVTVMH